MKIEIIEYYPIKTTNKKSLRVGTMHVYIENLDLDVRGIDVIKAKNSYIFHFPSRISVENGKKVRYPVISFANKATQDKIKKVLHITANKYMREKNGSQ